MSDGTHGMNGADTLSTIRIADDATGLEIVEAIRRSAVERGVAAFTLAGELSRHPAKWLDQVAAAKQPTGATIERVRALLEGRPVPPPPANNFRPGPASRPTGTANAPLPPLPPIIEPPSREPCFLCGVRGDIGCACRRPR
ncbi:hypothetical protein BH10PSE14_BH10PSE14_04750 [soil metagenome]